MKKIAEINIKADKSIDAKKFVSKVKEIVDDLNYDQDEYDNEIDIDEDLSNIVRNMYERDYSLKEVMEITGLSAEEIASIIEDID